MNEFDLHYSHNGAQELQLAPILREHADNFDIAREEGFGKINQVPQIEKWNSIDAVDSDLTIESKASEEAIERQPQAEKVPLKAIGLGVNFADIEAVYVVRNGRVETYFPVWLFPNVVRPWKENLTVDVYKSGKIPDNPVDLHKTIEDTEPLRTIGSEALTGNYTDDTIIERVVREQHANIYALCTKSAKEISNYDEDELKKGMILQTESYTLRINLHGEFDNIPTGTGKGMFVEIGDRTQRQLELAGATIRFDIGGRLNTLRHELTEDEFAEASAEAAIGAYNEFDDNISSFSPPPYGQIYEALSKIDNISSNAQSKIAKYLRRN